MVVRLRVVIVSGGESGGSESEGGESGVSKSLGW